MTSSDDLKRMLDEIGLARFVGRINSGVIPASEANEVVESLVSHEKERPLLSRITKIVLGKSDSYLNR